MRLSTHAVLAPALEAARAALRDLDADQVPNDLRRVAAYAGSLPPPLAKSLLKGLEQYEWLRDKAAGHLGGGAGVRDEAASLYLRRPEGWALALAGIALAEGMAAASSSERSSAGREESLEAALKAARAKVRGVVKDADSRIAELERRLAAATAERRADAAEEARAERARKRVLAEAEEAASAARAELAAAAREIEGLREDLAAERARSRRALAAAAEAAETDRWIDDPAGLAERIDHTAAMARPAARTAGTLAPAGGGAPAGLPPGVPPDGKHAIEWLIGLGAATVLIDGYNVGYSLPGERAPAPARARVEPIVRRLHTLAGGALRVVVVFDSDLGPAETPLTPGPATIRYSEAGETADDEIVRLAAGIDGTVVVISDDRAVRDRSERVGAIPLWSRALVAWSSSR